jgi:uncharacterized protein (TIGR00255 family)
MTGYGKGEATVFDRKFSIEIKSVNHRYNDLTIKLPRMLNPYEDRLRKSTAAAISRGKVEMFVNMETQAADDYKVRLNKLAANAYYQALSQLQNDIVFMSPADIQGLAESGIPLRQSSQQSSLAWLDILSRFPDIFSVDKSLDAPDEEIWQGLSVALDICLSRFTQMRKVEGDNLTADILGKKTQCEFIIKRIKERAPSIATEYAQKLRAKLDEALSGTQVDESRLITEITIMADRACIDEELTRLGSHMTQLESIIYSPGAVGRKLDFLVQEINREINTIGSKSNDVEITRLVVDLKSEVEKIREQVQNIE